MSILINKINKFIVIIIIKTYYHYKLLGTPTLSKLLEAPANPYIPSPQQASQKNKLSKYSISK
jgi:hypothetical protein